MNKSDLLDKGLRLRVVQRGITPEKMNDLFIYPSLPSGDEHDPAAVSFMLDSTKSGCRPINLRGGEHDPAVSLTATHAASVRDGLAIAHRMLTGPDISIHPDPRLEHTSIVVSLDPHAKLGDGGSITFKPGDDSLIIWGEPTLAIHKDGREAGTSVQGRKNLSALRDALIIICAIQGIE